MECLPSVASLGCVRCLSRRSVGTDANEFVWSDGSGSCPSCKQSDATHASRLLNTVVHGVQPSLDTPISWLCSKMSSQDNFLYISIV